MRIVLFDGIQEAHVGNSLERALVAAGHEVYNTGRFGRGFIFRQTDDLLPLLTPQLEAIEAFRPDWVLVFRPASAPYPILQALRGTGAQLAVWFSDDPVLFDLTYGPVLELYDLVLHCGNEAVLRFYQERFGRPTGVNFPFWTDHQAFPTVYGTQEPQTTALFLGNVAGPVRQARYEQLAGMNHPVRIFGQVDEDPAGLWGGFLDTDREVVEEGSRTRVALNIPQFFPDHRGLGTWFPGLDELGSFDLPSRVIQYAAMGIPTLSIVPGATGIRSFPELVVLDSIQAADAWIGAALAEGTLEDLGRRTAERFDRSFSAAARVRALESLFSDDSWRGLDAAERAVWFLQFDGREPMPAARWTPEGPPAGTGSPTRGAPAPRVVASEVMVLHGREAERFAPADVVMRELRALGGEPIVWGPARLGRYLTGVEQPFEGVVDAEALLASLGAHRPRFLILAEGLLLTTTGADLLRREGISTLLLLGEEMITPARAAGYDLVVRVGPAAVDRVALLQGEASAVHSPGLVESGFLRAVQVLREGTAGEGRRGVTVVASGADPVGDWAAQTLAGSASSGATAPGLVTAGDLAGAGLEDLASVLTRGVVYLQPVERGNRQLHPLVTPYAVCAAGTVVTTRHRTSLFPDLYGDWLTKASSPSEAALKMERATSWTDRRRGRRPDRSLDAGRQLERWLAQAATNRSGRPVLAPTSSPGPDGPDHVLAGSGGTMIHPDRRYRLDTSAGWGPADPLEVRLVFAEGGLIGGVRVSQGDRTVREARFPAGTAGGIEMTLAGRSEDAGEPVFVEFLGAARHRLREVAAVWVVTETSRGTRVHGITPQTPLTVFLVPLASASHRLS